MRLTTLVTLLTLLCLTACSAGAPTPASPVEVERLPSTASPTAAPLPTPSATQTAASARETAEQDPSAVPAGLILDVSQWKAWPVVPTLSPAMLQVYARGQELGREARVVSVVGDCESSSDWFLKDFSKGPRYYDLGPYTGLQATIDYFGESLGYKSYAALRGATAVTVLTPLWADHQACNKNETPLGCEYRLHSPAFAFIALGTNDVHKREQFEPRMREIITYTLEQGIVPILVTKADNAEGDESLNLTIARLAAAYQLPVWNFWSAVQFLPGQGLQPDGLHLTFGSNFFDKPGNLQNAWPVRNLTALQVLEAMRLAVQEF